MLVKKKEERREEERHTDFKASFANILFKLFIISSAFLASFSLNILSPSTFPPPPDVSTPLPLPGVDGEIEKVRSLADFNAPENCKVGLNLSNGHCCAIVFNVVDKFLDAILCCISLNDVWGEEQEKKKEFLFFRFL